MITDDERTRAAPVLAAMSSGRSVARAAVVLWYEGQQAVLDEAIRRCQTLSGRHELIVQQTEAEARLRELAEEVE